MKRGEAKNLAASVHQRLLNHARATGRPFNEVLQYYSIERFLYRLSVSKHSDSFVLKGALMFYAWGVSGFRPTRDIDLLGRMANAITQIEMKFREICTMQVEPDGLIFDAESVRGERITEDADYEGVRVTLSGALGNARINMQIDIGFADVVNPPPQEVEYPAILDFPSPRLDGYPRETLIAEKFQAMVALGEINSRMKDFFDIWLLSNRFEFDGAAMQRAIEGTFANRTTAIPAGPILFSRTFVDSKQPMWKAFLERIDQVQPNVDFAEVAATIERFLIPLTEASRNQERFHAVWRNGQGWDYHDQSLAHGS